MRFLKALPFQKDVLALPVVVAPDGLCYSFHEPIIAA